MGERCYSFPSKLLASSRAVRTPYTTASVLAEEYCCPYASQSVFFLRVSICLDAFRRGSTAAPLTKYRAIRRLYRAEVVENVDSQANLPHQAYIAWNCTCEEKNSKNWHRTRKLWDWIFSSTLMYLYSKAACGISLHFFSLLFLSLGRTIIVHNNNASPALVYIK